MMDWLSLTTLAQIDEIISDSLVQPVVIFKHSTTCSISQMAKLRLESTWNLDIKCYYLDLLVYRPLSSAVAERFSVHHESPQLLLIINGECIYDASHFDINVEEIQEALAYQNN
jgi:bacillithiol system protein YtxJ